MSGTGPDTPAFEAHDHGVCRRTVLARVEAICREERLRLTPIRREVLEILLDEHTALGAYDILARLAARGRAAQPPVAYRALDFLVSHGFAHRVQRLNAFVACTGPAGGHTPVFLICSSCRTVAEAVSEREASAPAARAHDFEVRETVIEAEGLCPACRPAET